MSRRLKLSLVVLASLQLTVSTVLLVIDLSPLSIVGLLLSSLLLGILLKVIARSSKESLTSLRENFDAFKEMSNHIAHDFSNPMHVIQFCGNSLQKYIDPAGEKFLKRILSSTDRSVEMIEELREISKVKHREHKNIYDVHRFVVALLRVEFWRHLKKSSIHLDENVRSLPIGIAVEDLIILLHTVYRIIICQHEKWSPIVDIGAESIHANEIQLRIASNVEFVMDSSDEEKLRKIIARAGGSIVIENKTSFLIILKGFFENYNKSISDNNINNFPGAHDGARLQ